ncbi:MAG: diguanylate cyclase [Fibrobacterales bacterium]
MKKSTALKTRLFPVLVVDDEGGVRRSLQRILEFEDIAVYTASNAHEGLALLSYHEIGLVLSDYRMPGMDGIEFLHKVRDEYPMVTRVMLTAYSEQSMLTSLINQGSPFKIAVKPWDNNELVSFIREGLENYRIELKNFESMDNLKKNKKNLHKMVYRLFHENKALKEEVIHDKMTGLLNHEASIEQVGTELARAKRQGTKCTLAILDVDNFKAINDTFGHLVGDRVIMSVADSIRRQLRRCDSGGRYGGDEFLLLLPDTDLNGAQVLIQRILDDVSNFLPDDVTGVSLSYGLAESHVHSPIDLIAVADQEMYAHKASRRESLTTIALESTVE